MIQWTHANVKMLCEMLAAGHSAREIGEVLGTTARAVGMRIYRMRANGDAMLPAAYRVAMTPSEVAKSSHRPASRTPISSIVDLPPRVDRDPCFRCGVRGDIGCEHVRCVA